MSGCFRSKDLPRWLTRISDRRAAVSSCGFEAVVSNLWADVCLKKTTVAADGVLSD